jgi:hypothetical protein
MSTATPTSRGQRRCFGIWTEDDSSDDDGVGSCPAPQADQSWALLETNTHLEEALTVQQNCRDEQGSDPEKDVVVNTPRRGPKHIRLASLLRDGMSVKDMTDDIIARGRSARRSKGTSAAQMYHTNRFDEFEVDDRDQTSVPQSGQLAPIPTADLPMMPAEEVLLADPEGIVLAAPGPRTAINSRGDMMPFSPRRPRSTASAPRVGSLDSFHCECSAQARSAASSTSAIAEKPAG